MCDTETDYPIVLPMTMEDFRCMPHRLGWKHDASFVVLKQDKILGAILVREAQLGPIVEPIMVRPSHHRRGLATALLRAALRALTEFGTGAIYSRCHLGNTVSLAWHVKNGFEEMPNYFSANHYWRHFSAMADHFSAQQNHHRAGEMRRLATKWREMTEQVGLRRGE